MDLAPGTPTTPISIGGLNGQKYLSSSPAVAGNVTINSYLGWVRRKNGLYTISLSSWNLDTLKQSEQLFDQILTTFQFTNQYQTDTSDWKTYPSSTTIGLPYSFKYPQNIEESEAQELIYLKTGSSTLYHHFAGKISDINALMNNYQLFGAPKVTFSSKSAETFNTVSGFKALTVDGMKAYHFLGNSSLNGFLVFFYDSNDSEAENLFNEIVETITIK